MGAMRLTPGDLLLLFTIGACAGLVGDGANVEYGVTRYIDDSVPFIWNSPVWFVALVGLATVATAIVRVQLGPTRPGFDLRIGAGVVAAALAIYAITSVAGDDGAAAVTLVVALAVLTACFVADGPGLICGLAAAVIGPAVEIAIVKLDLSEYTALNDSLFGVGLWLPGLYFAFGVAVARIAELLIARRAETVS